MSADPQLVEYATVVPTVGLSDQRFARSDFAQVKAALDCICVVDQASEVGDKGETIVVPEDSCRDGVEHFCEVVWKAVEANPNAHRLQVMSPPNHNMFVPCFIALLCLRSGLGRSVACEIVQPHLLPVPGWSKGYVWRVRAMRLGSLSPELIHVLADRMRNIAMTSR